MRQLRTRKCGSAWEWSFEGTEINGKHNPISHGGYRTEAKAITAGTQAKAEYDSAGRRFTPSDISVFDYLDYWYDNYVKTSPSYNTQKDCEKKIRVHLKLAFGKYRLASLETDVIRKWIDRMKRQSYSRNMVKNTLPYLSDALGCAVYPCEYIEYNPYDYARISEIVMSGEAKAHTECVCIKEDFTAIIGRFGPDSNFYISLMTGYHCDTRLGKTYGIDLLYDVDFEHYTITIRHQLTSEGGKWYYRPPKYSSVRTIKILPECGKILKTGIHNHKKGMLRYGRHFTRAYQMDDGLVFQAPSNVKIVGKEIMPVNAKENGELLTPYSFKYCAKVIHEELGNPLSRSHCLRRTHGTLLARNDTQPKAAMERLGHKDVETTTDRYVFSTEEMQNNAIVTLADTIS